MAEEIAGKEVVAWHPGRGDVAFRVQFDPQGRPTNVPVGAEFEYQGQHYVGTQYGTLSGTDPRAKEAFGEAAAAKVTRAAAPRTAAEEAAITGVARVTTPTRRQLEARARAEGRWDPVAAKITSGEGFVAPRVRKPLPALKPTPTGPGGIRLAPGARVTHKGKTYVGTAEGVVEEVKVRQVPIALGAYEMPSETKAKVEVFEKRKPLTPEERLKASRAVKKEIVLFEGEQAQFERASAAFEPKRLSFEEGVERQAVKVSEYEARRKAFEDAGGVDATEYAALKAKYSTLEKARVELEAEKTQLSKELKPLQTLYGKLETKGVHLEAKITALQPVDYFKAARPAWAPKALLPPPSVKKEAVEVTWGTGETTVFESRTQAEAAMATVEKIREQREQAVYEMQHPLESLVFAKPEEKGEPLLTAAGRTALEFGEMFPMAAIGVTTAFTAGQRRVFAGKPPLTPLDYEVYTPHITSAGFTVALVGAGALVGRGVAAVAPRVMAAFEAVPPVAKGALIVGGITGVPASLEAAAGEITWEQAAGKTLAGITLGAGIGVMAKGYAEGLKASVARPKAISISRFEAPRTVYAKEAKVPVRLEYAGKKAEIAVDLGEKALVAAGRRVGLGRGAPPFHKISVMGREVRLPRLIRAEQYFVGEQAVVSYAKPRVVLHPRELVKFPKSLEVQRRVVAGREVASEAKIVGLQTTTYRFLGLKFKVVKEPFVSHAFFEPPALGKLVKRAPLPKEGAEIGFPEKMPKAPIPKRFKRDYQVYGFRGQAARLVSEAETQKQFGFTRLLTRKKALTLARVKGVQAREISFVAEREAVKPLREVGLPEAKEGVVFEKITTKRALKPVKEVSVADARAGVVFDKTAAIKTRQAMVSASKTVSETQAKALQRIAVKPLTAAEAKPVTAPLVVTGVGVRQLPKPVLAEKVVEKPLVAVTPKAVQLPVVTPKEKQVLKPVTVELAKQVQKPVAVPKARQVMFPVEVPLLEEVQEPILAQELKEIQLPALRFREVGEPAPVVPPGAVPPVGIVTPPFGLIPPTFGFKAKARDRPQLFGRRTKYAPSLLAKLFDIRAMRVPKGLTGLELRPMVSFGTRKKRKR